MNNFILFIGGAVGASSVLLMVPNSKAKPSVEHPQGIVVSLIVNMQSVSLSKTAMEITRCLDEHLESVE